MVVDQNFPRDPHVILPPSVRWKPDAATNVSKLATSMPPLVEKLRRAVQEWRNGDYQGATQTSKLLLRWWFENDHPIEREGGSKTFFRYYFAQREAVETIIYLADVIHAYDAHALMRFNSSDGVSEEDFDEKWPRYVVKMATGSGKTKVMSLVLAWSYFHKCYEPESPFSRNFLVIAPNVIVLERLKSDFDGLKIFYTDPILPPDEWEGKWWKRDFQSTMKVHVQDQVRLNNPIGNIFLTNIHRVYENKEKEPTADDDNVMDYFLGARPSDKSMKRTLELEDIVRDIDELMVINDEAHHIHDKELEWFKSIVDINNKLKKKGSALSLQIDVTATPKNIKGGIFVQTISDYPLVEAITQNVVKQPVVPDEKSRIKLEEKKSSKFTQRYSDFLHLGVEEWKKAYERHERLDKKAVLFIMTDDTKNCDEVKDWLEQNYSDLTGAVLVIHTNKSGDIKENATTTKDKKELDKLREQANKIDSKDSPYKAVVSVLMLKEGWDVQNVTTIVGLRSYSVESKILPEQTLGRGLRRMYREEDVDEKVSVLGTDAFMEFVENIKEEGVELQRKAMGEKTEPIAPLVIEIDQDGDKDIDQLDIEIPQLSRRFNRNYRRLEDLDESKLTDEKIPFRSYSQEELSRTIIFQHAIENTPSHETELKTAGDQNSIQLIIGWFAMKIIEDLKLIRGTAYHILYEKLKKFVQDHLFDRSVKLEDKTTIRNLSEGNATALTLRSFKDGINNLTIEDKGSAQVIGKIRLKETKTFPVNNQEFYPPKKCVFNRIVGDSYLELLFAAFLDDCQDVRSFSKLYRRVNFTLDYVDAKGKIRQYCPDFIVKLKDGRIVIVETKGLVDEDVPLKIKRLRSWCEDINASQSQVHFHCIIVPEKEFEDLKENYNSGAMKGRKKSFAHALDFFSTLENPR